MLMPESANGDSGIAVRASDQIRVADGEMSPQQGQFFVSCLVRLRGTEHRFELEKSPAAEDLIEVDPYILVEKNLAVFFDDTDDAQRARQSLFQQGGIDDGDE